MDRDEKIAYLLTGVGLFWMFGGLALVALVAQWLRAQGITCPGLGKGLMAYHLVVLSIIAFGAVFFWFRANLRSGGLAAAFLVILQVLTSYLMGVAFWRLLGERMKSWLLW
jgi:hypothetical protein